MSIKQLHRKSSAWRASSVWQLAAPMILANLSVPLLGFIDMAVVGHLSHAYYLAAVAVGAVIFDLLYITFNFLRTATTGLIAQAYGREDSNTLRTVFGQSLLVAIFIGLILIALQAPLAEIAFVLVAATPEVAYYAQIYFSIRIWAAPATLINYVILGWFIGIHNTRTPLLLVLITNLLNIIGNIILVLVFDWGVAGVAIATLAAQYISLALGLWFITRALKGYPGVLQWQSLLSLKKYAALFLVNSALFIRTLCLQLVFLSFVYQGSKLGTSILAANSVLVHFQLFMAYGLDGFANAAEALVGRAIGRKNYQEFKQAVRDAALWSGYTMLGFTILYLLLGNFIIALITSVPQVQLDAEKFLPWVIILPLISVWSYLFDGVFIGATRFKAMLKIMLASVFLVFIPVWYFAQPLGNHGLWLAFTLFMLVRSLLMSGVFWHINRRHGFINS